MAYSAESSSTSPSLDIVIPVLNEAHVLEASVNKVRAYLARHIACRWRIIIANNGSTDGTLARAEALAREHAAVSVLHIERKGRGLALRRAWMQSTADIVGYMDVDLSTELEALPAALSAIQHDGFDAAIGSRRLPESRIKRCARREILSRVYNGLVKCALRAKFSDAQCGFKFFSRAACDELLPLVRNESWFFDTELLVLAEQHGYRVKDVPVTWDEDRDSRVKVIQTVWENLREVVRLRGVLRERHAEFAGARAHNLLLREASENWHATFAARGQREVDEPVAVGAAGPDRRR